MCEIRLLRADEIDVRAQSVTEKGAVLLLYKDARVDMDILDETFGMKGWQREHTFKDGKNYCKVSIWDIEKLQWIAKEDIGTESKSDAEKGEASDAFKRACVNVGIGRELYTSPFIWVAVNSAELDKRGDRYCLKSSVKLKVKSIGYDDKRNINSLVIIDHNGKPRYEMGRRTDAPQQQVADPVSSAQPATTPERKPLLMEHLANDDMCKQVMNWVYNANALDKDLSKFNPLAWIRKRRIVADDVAVIFKEKYNIYFTEKQKRK